MTFWAWTSLPPRLISKRLTREWLSSTTLTRIRSQTQKKNSKRLVRINYSSFFVIDLITYSKTKRKQHETISAQAFDILSNPEKRAAFDRYGEDGLKGNVRRHSHSANEHPFPDNFGHFASSRSFHGHIDPFEIFRSFFGTRDPFSDLLFQNHFHHHHHHRPDPFG